MSTGAASTRRSSRRRQRSAAATATADNNNKCLSLPDFPRPWNQHYIDIEGCRLSKCTRRIQESSDADIQRLPVSCLSLAIKASYGGASGSISRQRREQDLMTYAQAALARGIAVNDYESRCGSAVSAAAYYGYERLLQWLLDEAGCSVIGNGKPHALMAAVRNGQHGCLRLLLQRRPDEIKNQMRQESLATWPATQITTLHKACLLRDVEAVRLLRDHQSAAKLLMLVPTLEKRLEEVLVELYPNTTTNIKHWQPQLHWSFPGTDRRLLNWLWQALERQQRQASVDAQLLLPREVWLRVFSFVGRNWWMASGLDDQNEGRHLRTTNQAFQ